MGIVSALLSTNKAANENCRLLICAPSNTAVDEILARLLHHGVFCDGGGQRKIKMVRLGHPLEDAPESIQELSLERQTDQIVKSSDIYKQYLGVCEIIEKLYAQLKALDLADGKQSGAAENLKVDGDHKSIKETTTRIRVALASRRKERSVIIAEVDSYRLEVQARLLKSADVVAGTLSSRCE
jgi:hypothetical protein